VRGIEFLIGLLAVVALGVWVARALRLPYPIFLVVVGAGLGFVPGVPEVRLNPNVVFLVFLPPLVHAAAYRTSIAELRANWAAISGLALGLVAVTIVAVAAAAHSVIPGLGWAEAFVLGAVVAPTDPVAATTIFHRLGASRQVASIVEGESLVNDASGLVAYRIAVAAAATGTFSLGHGIADLVVVSVGGAAIGFAVAVVIAELRRRLDDPLIEITLTLLTPYVAYVAAEEAGTSGILAAVVTGLWLGARAHELFAPSTRLEAYAFWGVLTFLLETTLFVLVGLQFPAVLDALGGRSPGELAGYAAVVAATVILVRLLWALLLGFGVPVRHRLVVGWAGMRGAVSLAAALAVPLNVPGRDLIVFLSLAVIAVTLILQGLTLPAVIRAGGVEEEIPDARKQALTRFRTVEAALERIGELSFREDVPPGAVERARALYTQRARQLAGECREGVPQEGEGDVAAWLRLRRELLGVERAKLIEMRDQGEISPQVAAAVERELDLEESRLLARQSQR
jgi:monovalent cation/hydrogen antiporter